MGDIKLFNVGGSTVSEIAGSSVTLERSLQKLIEENLETFLGVRFLRSEYSTGRDHGRIDTLGIDENGCPVIIEYKRAINANVITQGLFYLDWLMNHQGDFERLVSQQIDENMASNVEWAAPRLLCIAGGFNRYDKHAVNQIDRNIELIQYRKYGDDLLLFELISAVTAQRPAGIACDAAERGNGHQQEYPEQVPQDQRDRFEALRAFILALGDDVQERTLQNYVAFRRLRNFACIPTRKNSLTVYVNVNPDTIECEEGFTRNVRNIGKQGTGDLEITIASDADFERAKPIIERSYGEVS